MRHTRLTGPTALAALLAGVLLAGMASAADAADGGTPLRMKLEVTDGKTRPPPHVRTELRLRVQGGDWTGPRIVAQPQNQNPGAVSLLSYCPTAAESRSVVHRACYLDTEPEEPRVLTAMIERAAQPIPTRGKMAPPRPVIQRPVAQRETAILFSTDPDR